MPPASAVWPSDATKLVAEDSGGGFVPPAPAESPCNANLGMPGTYTVTVSDKKLVFRVCVADASDSTKPHRWVDGMKALTNSEYDSLVAALHNVMVSTRPDCGADKPTLTLKVSSAAGERTYLDVFYACQMQGTYVTGMDGVFGVLQSLAKP